MDPNNPMSNILQMAQKIAQDIPKSDIENNNIDMPKMVHHVAESVTQMMGTGDMDLTQITSNLVKTFETMQQGSFEEEGVVKPIANSKVKLNVPKKTDDCFEELDDDTDADQFHPRTKDLHFNLNVNLEEFYKGKNKEISY